MRADAKEQVACTKLALFTSSHGFTSSSEAKISTGRVLYSGGVYTTDVVRLSLGVFSRRKKFILDAYVGKDIEVRPGRVIQLHRNVKRNHNVIIYRHARHCGRLLRGQCDESAEEEKTRSVSFEWTECKDKIRILSILDCRIKSRLSNFDEE